MIDIHWWHGLEQQWKDAFAAVFFMHTNEPSQEELSRLYEATALRFAGPGAPYPNMDFELTNLSGIASLPNLQVLVAVHQQIQQVDELENLNKLTALFLYYNQVSDISPLTTMVQLQQLYIQGNHIETLLPLQALTGLKELYVNENKISSLEGLSEAHADCLEQFFCMPNSLLKTKELLKTERELGIRCRTA